MTPFRIVGSIFVSGARTIVHVEAGPGDRIAAAGAFLIDAETRLNPPSRSRPAGLGAAADDPR